MYLNENARIYIDSLRQTNNIVSEALKEHICNGLAALVPLYTSDGLNAYNKRGLLYAMEMLSEFNNLLDNLADDGDTETRGKQGENYENVIL